MKKTRIRYLQLAENTSVHLPPLERKDYFREADLCLVEYDEDRQVFEISRGGGATSHVKCVRVHVTSVKFWEEYAADEAKALPAQPWLAQYDKQKARFVPAAAKS